MKMKKLGHRYLEKSITSGGNKHCTKYLASWRTGQKTRVRGGDEK